MSVEPSVTLPWPPKELSPNARVHHKAKARVAKAYRETAWALELGGFEDRRLLPSIAWALEHLPERAPNAVEFRALCRRAPIEPVPAPALPAPKETDAQRAWREAHAQVIASGEAGGNEDGKKWARALLAMKKRGFDLSFAQREAVRIAGVRAV